MRDISKRITFVKIKDNEDSHKKPSIMNKRTFLTAASLLASVLTSSAQSVTCRVTGEVADKAERQILLYEHGTDPRTGGYISIDIKDGRFSYLLETDMLKCYEVVLRNEYERGAMRVADFIAENADVHITIPHANYGKKDGFRFDSDGKENRMKAKYTAYKDSIYALYSPAFKKLESRRDSLQKEKLYFKPIVYEIYEKLKSVQGARKDSLLKQLPKDVFSELGSKTEAEYKDLVDSSHAERAKWLESNPCFYGLVEINKNVVYSRLPRTQGRFTAIFLDHYLDFMPKHPYHRMVVDGIAAARLQVGKPYIDYEVQGPTGKAVKLSSLYQGKIIFINMWASWCGPCRRHAKELLPVYEKYKDKGLQVIGIARENAAEAMEKAIRQDGYPWLNLLELNDRHHVWQKNGINNAAGGGFLIDDKGTILSIYPEADELEKILKERL